MAHGLRGDAQRAWAVAVASVPQSAVLGVLRELEAGAAVGLQARRRTLALRRLRVVPVVAPDDGYVGVVDGNKNSIDGDSGNSAERGNKMSVGAQRTINDDEERKEVEAKRLRVGSV